MRVLWSRSTITGLSVRMTWFSAGSTSARPQAASRSPCTRWTLPVASMERNLSKWPRVAVGSPLRITTTRRKSQVSLRLVPMTTTFCLKVMVVSLSVLTIWASPSLVMVVTVSSAAGSMAESSRTKGNRRRRRGRKVISAGLSARCGWLRGRSDGGKPFSPGRCTPSRFPWPRGHH